VLLRQVTLDYVQFKIKITFGEWVKLPFFLIKYNRMRVLNIGLMVQGVEPYKGLEKELHLQSTDYRSIPLSGDKNKELLNTAREFRPDIIFMQLQREGIITVDTVRQLHEEGFKVINWTGDVRTPIPQFYFDLAPYCVTSFSNMTDVNIMREYGFKSEYLQIGYDPEVFYKKDVYKDLDIVFMGNNYREGKFPLSTYRIEMVNRMRKEFGERFKVYGNGWEFSSGDLNGDQHKECDVYNRAKIGINLSHFNYSRYSSDRMFRLMGSGCFCLTHNYEDIDKDFKIGTISIWKDIDELIEKCRLYLESPTDYMITDTAQKGYEYVRENYTYKQMAENILKL